MVDHPSSSFAIVDTMRRRVTIHDLPRTDELSLRPGEIEQDGTVPDFTVLKIPLYSRLVSRDVVKMLRELADEIETLSNLTNEMELRVVKRQYWAVLRKNRELALLDPRRKRRKRVDNI